MLKKTAVLFFFAILAAGGLFAQDAALAQEMSSSVPELEEFHEIIYPIWHTAYPSKDIEALKGFVEEINKLAAPIYAVKLPGILRDKQAKWDAGIAEFRKSVDAYNAAAKGSDDQALLDAAEALHARYEGLVRAIRPVLKEVDAYHQTLYIVFHKLLPAGKWAEIKTAAAELATKADAVVGATLSKRLESRADAYKAAAAELKTATTALVAAGEKGDAASIEAAVNAVHTKYQALEKVFD
jgi:hypothetical protein